MSFYYEENEIIEKLRKQKSHLRNSSFKSIEKYKVNRNNKTKEYSVNNETDIMEEEGVNIGWENSRVYDGIEIKKFLKCKGNTHLAKECTD